MTTQKFDATPTPTEGINLDIITEDNVKAAWKAYENRPEYKEFNKHDLIESLQPNEEDKKGTP